MNKYSIRIAATVYYNVEVEAENKIDAVEQIKKHGFKCKDEEIEWDLTTIDVLNIT